MTQAISLAFVLTPPSAICGLHGDHLPLQAPPPPPLSLSFLAKRAFSPPLTFLGLSPSSFRLFSLYPSSRSSRPRPLPRKTFLPTPQLVASPVPMLLMLLPVLTSCTAPSTCTPASTWPADCIYCLTLPSEIEAQRGIFAHYQHIHCCVPCT